MSTKRRCGACPSITPFMMPTNGSRAPKSVVSVMMPLARKTAMRTPRSVHFATMSRTPETVNRIAPQVSIGTFALLCSCFVVSGVAALVYQTAWTRQFAIVFGTSELAVATVLAAYMGGLALGAWLAERFLPRVTRPVMTYALLELGIAAGALFAVPFLIWLANRGLIAFFGGQPAPPDGDHAATTAFYLVSAFVALALPTTLMGATLPMLARYAVVS